MMIERYARWLLCHCKLVIVASLTLIILASYGATHLRFQADYRIFFGPKNPQLQAFEAIQNTYSKFDNALFVISPKDGNVFTKETLTAVEAITQAGWQLPYAGRVDSLTNFQHTTVDGDDLWVNDLVPAPEDLTVDTLQHIRQIALEDPTLVDNIVSADARVTAVNVTFQMPGIDQTVEVPIAANAAEAMQTKLSEEYPELDIRLTGVVMLNHAFVTAALDDAQTLIPLMFGLIILGIGLFMRSILATCASVLLIICSIAPAMGMGGWLGIDLSSPSMSAPTIIMTLAVAHCIHLIASFRVALSQGANKHDALVESLRINAEPFFITSFTTIIGFLTLNFSDAPPFHDLGNIVAMGVVFAYFLVMTLFPALIMLLPINTPTQAPAGSKSMQWLGEFVIKRRRIIFNTLGAVIIVLVAFAPMNELNDVFIDYFDESTTFRQNADYLVENLGGFGSIQYSLAANGPGGIYEPEYLKTLERFSEWLSSQPEIKHVNSIVPIMKRLNKNMHANDTAYYRISDDRTLNAQYLLLYELSLPYGLDLTNQINLDKSATRITASIDKLSSVGILDLEDRAAQWLMNNAPASMQDAEGTGPDIMFSHIGQLNIVSMLKGGILALFLISGILCLALKSWRYGLMSMIPNLAPIGMAFGLWGIYNGQVGLSLSVVASITLGIVVDDTVHFLSKYRRARKEKNLNAPDGIRYAFANVGTALWTTTLILVAGFLVLTLSPFALNKGMGLLASITLVLALVADFLFLPTMLLKAEGDNA